MNAVKNSIASPMKTLIAAAVASALLAACASTPVESNGAVDARAKLTRLEADPDLANRAPLAISAAERAVRVAEQPQTDRQLEAYRVYVADRKVETARAQAETAFLESQRPALMAQRERARLRARTREADVAQDEAAAARANTAEEKAAADQARREARVARAAAAKSKQRTESLQQKLKLLHAKSTDRGLVLTLGDVLFTNGHAALKAGASRHLNRLVTFLKKHPTRTVAIQGYTDNVGSKDYNLGLSEQRADSVRAYLIGQGIQSTRITTSGEGESDPVASNASAFGRQQNRRVEVIISDPSATLR
jgi:outer membrane protein OmpA-like peptidoglycan-associated protein